MSRLSTSNVGNMKMGAVALVAAGLLLLVWSGTALGAAAWRLDVLSNTTAAANASTSYMLQVTNVGSTASADPGPDGIPGTGDDVAIPVTLTATLPPGWTADSLTGGGIWSCTGFGTADLSCDTGANVIAARDPINYSAPVLNVTIPSGASGTLTPTFKVSGGGAAEAVASADPTRISATPPPFGIDAVDGQVTADGSASAPPFTQAGGHPYAASLSVDFNTRENTTPLIGALWPIEATKDVLVDLPPGLVGNPTVLGKCTAADLAPVNIRPFCPPSSQVGTALVRINGLGARNIFGPVGVYSMEPPPGVPARFGMNVQGSVVTLDARVRTEGDYGLSIDTVNIPEGLPVAGSTVTLWGVPADPVHDPERFCPGKDAPIQGGPLCSVGGALKAFLRNPTACTPPGVGLPTTARIDSWANPGHFEQATFMSHLPLAYPFSPGDWGREQGPDNCGPVPFNATLAAKPGFPAQSGEPTGFQFDLAMPQNDDPSVLGHSDLKKAVVTLPKGVRVSPSSAGGLEGCSAAQIGLDRAGYPSCPERAKIGSLTVETPLLDDDLTGAIYLATPFDNKFNALIAVYLVARGPGVVLKLPGKVQADPQTGQLTATFDDNPQLPFSKLHLEFKGGPRAPLVLARECGTYSTHPVLTGWSAKTAAVDSSFVVDQGCTPTSTFAPTLEAGVVNPVAGASSSFSLRLQRDDADQEIRSVTTRLPEGLLAHVGDVAQCTSVPACSEASQIGRVTVGAGAGPSPFFIDSGKVYLTGPYRGAPFGLLIRVPAVAGPFDLGTVDVRAALRIDPVTAAATVIADPLPRYLQGIPVLAKDIRVSIDRPGFMVSPTDCTPTTIGAGVDAFDGATAELSDRFQVGECESLALKPKLAIALTGRGQSTDGKHPGVTATVSQTAGQANLDKVKVSLPLSLALDPDNAQALCEFADGSKVDPVCPKGSIVGTATAKTPLLAQPLSGPVYFVKNIRTDPKSGRQIRTLPKIVIPLTGQNGVRLNLVGTSNVEHDRLVTTFANIPDAPVSSFTLNITGGKHGILVVSNTDICKATQTAAQQIDGQNGKTADADLALQTPGCPLRVQAKKLGRRSVSVTVSGLGAGKITVSGKGIKKTTRTIAKSTVATVTAQRTTGRPREVRVSFLPAGARKARIVSTTLR